MASLPRVRISKKRANAAEAAVIIPRCVLPAILFLFPWYCQSLLANFGGGRWPDPEISSPMVLAPLAETKSSTSTANSAKLSLGRTEHFCSSDVDCKNVIGSKENPQRPRELNQQQLLLFSLNWIQESDPGFYRKKDVRRLWEWKDTALGDGRDFFVPKPKTLMALQNYLLENISYLSECSVISNCARLEVLCCCSTPVPTDYSGTQKDKMTIENELQDLLARDISNCFVAQLNNYRIVSKNANAWTKAMMQLPINSDRPQSVLTTAPPTKDSLKSIAYYDSWWNVTIGTEAILTRICKVSAGMGQRPRRPDRPVVFRPFSSRDAHVLLQLKRTRENIAFSSDRSNGAHDESTSSKDWDYSNRGGENSAEQLRKRKYLPVVLDCALRAGKAARNPAIVPEIEELREMTSAESSDCSPMELSISERVADAAFRKGILPLVKECTMKLDYSTQSTDQRISEFRRKAFDFLQEIESKDSEGNLSFRPELRSWLNRRLHEPTTALRSQSQEQIKNGDRENRVDIDSYLRVTLEQIRMELGNEVLRLEKQNDDRITS